MTQELKRQYERLRQQAQEDARQRQQAAVRRCPELGSLKLRLDPTCPPFILVKTTDGRSWLFGTRDEASTRAVFEKLKG